MRDLEAFTIRPLRYFNFTSTSFSSPKPTISAMLSDSYQNTSQDSLIMVIWTAVKVILVLIPNYQLHLKTILKRILLLYLSNLPRTKALQHGITLNTALATLVITAAKRVAKLTSSSLLFLNSMAILLLNHLVFEYSPVHHTKKRTRIVWKCLKVPKSPFYCTFPSYMPIFNAFSLKYNKLLTALYNKILFSFTCNFRYKMQYLGCFCNKP